MPVMKLTKRAIDTVTLPEKQNEYRDPIEKGLILICYKSERKQFMFRYQINGKRRSIKMGDYGALTIDAAKVIARKFAADVAKVHDPQDMASEQRQMPTFTQWAEDYLTEVRNRKKRPDNDERFLGMAVKRYGNKKLDKVTRTDVQNQMRSLKSNGTTNVTANRYHASIRACLSEAVRAGIITTNVAASIRHYPEPIPRDRTLSDDEMARVLEAIEQLPSVFARTAFHMLLETGARKTEVLVTKWADVNFNDGLWRLPDTKAGKPQVIPLSASIMARLRLLPRSDSPYLFPGIGEQGHLMDLKKPWAAVRKAADTPDIRMHDVRRTFGLHIARTAGLHIASKLLRHSSIKVTEQHYAPLGTDELRAALDKPEAEIVPMVKVNG